MMKKYLLGLAILLALLASCHPQHMQALLQKAHVVPDSICYNFDTIKRFSLLEVGGHVVDNAYPYHTDDFEIFYFSQVYQCRDDAIIQQFLSTCEQSAINIINYSDSDFFIMNREAVLLAQYDTSFLEDRYSRILDCSCLVPDFQSLFEDYPFTNSAKEAPLPENVRVYVLKAGNNFILSSQYSYDWMILPDIIRHGYSSGIAFNESTPNNIYSWAIAW